MKTKLLLTAVLVVCALAQQAAAQSPGDYKSNGTGGGAWNDPATWVVYSGSGYVAAAAPPINGTNIRVQGGDSVRINSTDTLSNLTVDSSGIVTVGSGQIAMLSGGITVNGAFGVNGTLVCHTNIISGKGSFVLYAGASLYIGSPNGISASGATGNIQTAVRQFSSAANYTYTSTNAQVTGTGLPANITGTITDVNTNAATGLTLSQNISVNGAGRFIVLPSAVLTCKGATAIIGTGSFELQSGATFFIGHAAGISATPGVGCVTVTGRRLFSADANYAYNGSVSQTVGSAFPSPFTGMLTIANSHPDGCVLNNNLIITAPGRVVVNGSLACAAYTISGSGTFTLNTGATLLTGHPSGLSAAGAYGSVQTAGISYNTAASYIYNGSVNQATGDGLPLSVNTLGVNTTGGSTVSLTNNSTISNNLALTAGTLCLNGKTLTMGVLKTITRQNGTLAMCGGSLVYAGQVNVTYTSTTDITPDTEMPSNPAVLSNLTVALSAGKTLTLTAPVTVNGAVVMTNGLFVPGNYLTYGPNASLVYSSGAPQTVGAEWPDSGFNVNISIRNANAAAGVVLNANKTAYSGTLTVRSGGYFNTGDYTLSGNGSIVVSAGGTFMTPHPLGVCPEGAIRLTGNRNFTPGSSYTFNGTVPQVTGREMPLSVANITINSTGSNRIVTLINNGKDTQTITGTLILTSGLFDLNTTGMNLLFHSGNVPISRTAGRIWLAPVASLQFGTTGLTGGSAFTLPNDVFSGTAASFKSLVINRANTLTLGNQSITLSGTLRLTVGVLNLGATTLTLQDNDMPLLVESGSITAGPNASLQFGTAEHTGGAAFTLPDRLFTLPPSFANLTVHRQNRLTLGAQNLTLSVALTLTKGDLYMGTGALQLNGTLAITNGALKGGPTAKLVIGGKPGTFSVPAIDGGLGMLTIARKNDGSTPSVLLGADLSIDSVLNLDSGSVALGNHNLTLNAAAAIRHASTTRYIVTTNIVTSSGYLIGQAGAEPVLFPVGTGTYTPAVVAKAGRMQPFRVRVYDGIQAATAPGTPFNYSKEAVNKTWVIEKVNPDTTPASVTLYWNAGDENASFDRSKSFVSTITGTDWDTTSATAAQPLDSIGFSQTRDNITSFSRFSIQKDRSVRVAKWLSFAVARNESVISLNWIVGNGKGLRDFEIERSTDGVSFQTIGSLTAIDSTAPAMAYVFDDISPVLFQPSYYRLKQYTIDNQFEYSKTVKVLPERVIGSVVYPVPVQRELHIALYATRSGMVAICMIDLSGHLVKKQAAHLTRGNNILTVPVQDLPKGMYVVQVIGDQVLWESHKVVK